MEITDIALVVKIYFVSFIILLLIFGIRDSVIDYSKDKSITTNCINRSVLSVSGFDIRKYGAYFVSDNYPNLLEWKIVRVENRITEKGFLIPLDDIKTGVEHAKDTRWF